MLRRALAFAATLFGVSGLAALWRTAGWATPIDPHYPVTTFFTGCIGLGFASVFLYVTALLGWATAAPLAVTLGALAPLPIALTYEAARDPTSHNLFPFEIALLWVPALALAYGASKLGALLRVLRDQAGTHAPSSHPPSA
jgi:hypothetical protein